MLNRYTFLLSISLFSLIYGWGCNIHKLTVDMIKPFLSKDTENQMLAILNQSTIVQRKQMQVETISDPVCLPDVIKRERRYRSSASWHYLDIDYDPDDDSPISEEFFSPYVDGLYTSIINQFYIFKESPVESEKGDALLFLLHLLADAMQPFHVIQLRTDEYPDGDKGGLKYSLYHSSSKNLHYLSDNLVNFFSKKDFQDENLPHWMNEYCEQHYHFQERYGVDFEDLVQDWLVDSHNRGIQVYRILNGSHTVNKSSIPAIQEILLEGVCQSTPIFLHVIKELLL